MLRTLTTLLALLPINAAVAQFPPAASGGDAPPQAGAWAPPSRFAGGAATPFTQPTDPQVPPVRLAQSTEAISRPASPTAAPPAASRRGLLQSLDFTADWAPRTGDEGLGLTTLSASIGTGVPPSVLGTPLLIKPRVGLTLLDGPSTLDAPASLNDFEVSFGTFKKLSPKWSVRASVSLGVYADDDSLDDADAFRLSGFGLALYDYSPQWQWAFGAAYLNRDDVSVIPAVGVIHDRGWIRYELIAPRPRIVWSLGQGARGRDRSVYLAGQFGGGAWAVRRDSGATDTLNLSSFGLLLGYELAGVPGAGPLSPDAWKTRYEIGYLFGRDLEYADSGEEISLADSLIARVGWTY